MLNTIYKVIKTQRVIQNHFFEMLAILQLFGGQIKIVTLNFGR